MIIYMYLRRFGEIQILVTDKNDCIYIEVFIETTVVVYCTVISFRQVFIVRQHPGYIKHDTYTS